MGRVNVEERCFGELRLSKLETLMGWNRREALGCLVLLWHESQDKLAVTASSQQISEWAWSRDDLEGQRIVSALAKAGYIHLQSDGLYLIKGNEPQIEGHVQQLTAAKKGGEATKQKWAKLKADRLAVDQAGDQADRLADTRPTGIAIEGRHQAQYNTNQNNAEQDSAEDPKGSCGHRRSPRAPYRELFDIWNANCGTLPKVDALPESLKQKIRARWGERPDLAYWEQCARKMGASKFCCEGSWATFHWLMRNDTNHVKVSEGNYDNRDGKGGGMSETDWSKVFEGRQ